MLRVTFLSFVLISLFSCHPANILTYKYKRYYHEKSTLFRDTTIELEQRIRYNRPNTVDEEFSYFLNMSIIDTAAAIQRKRLYLVADTSIVRSYGGRFSVWDWESEGNTVSGWVKILRWGAHRITVKENVSVYDRHRKEKKRFKGRRTFRLEKAKN